MEVILATLTSGSDPLNLSTLIIRTLQYWIEYIILGETVCNKAMQNGKSEHDIYIYIYTGELGYDGPLYDRLLHMTDDILGPSHMHIKYVS